MGEKTDYDILYREYLERRRIYQSDDPKKSLRESLEDMKLRLEAYGNGSIPDFEKNEILSAESLPNLGEWFGVGAYVVNNIDWE